MSGSDVWFDSWTKPYSYGWTEQTVLNSLTWRRKYSLCWVFLAMSLRECPTPGPERCGAHELEWLHYTVLFMMGSGGVPPEVHNHLPCFERVKLVFWTLVYREKSIGESTHPWGAPVLIVRVLMWVYPASLAGDPLTDWGGHGELGQFVWEKVRHDGIEGRTEVHK